MATKKPNVNEFPARPGPASRPTGFVIVRFKESVPPDSLRSHDVAVKAGLSEVFRVMERYGLKGASLIEEPARRERIARLEQDARKTEFAPLRSLLSYWRFDARTSGLGMDAVKGILRGQPGVASVSVETGAVEAGTQTDKYLGDQGYLTAGPKGIDAIWAWNQPGGRGKGTAFLDIERGWLLEHEDLPQPALLLNDNYDIAADRLSVRSHGAAVLGIVAALQNDKGISGIAPDADSVRVASIWRQDGTGGWSQIVTALTDAVDLVPRPDVVAIEVQIAWWIPAETEPLIFDAIRLATAAGICVVEVAGNLGFDLDTYQNEDGVFSLNRGAAGFEDSGAILVGSADADPAHAPRPSSNYGSRVDCYAWGEQVVASGGGDLGRGAGDDSTYTASFGGTSAATAIIAGAALVVQGLATAAPRGQRLAPAQVREWLSDPNTGTPQGAGGHIGVMPNLKLIAQTRLGLS